MNAKPHPHWQPPGDVRPFIVCAACITRQDTDGQIVLVGPRHWGATMRQQLEMVQKSYPEINAHQFEQGFIDQWSNFHTRKEAMVIVKASGQPFDRDRNGCQDRELYSEGLY